MKKYHIQKDSIGGYGVNNAEIDATNLEPI